MGNGPVWAGSTRREPVYTRPSLTGRLYLRQTITMAQSWTPDHNRGGEEVATDGVFPMDEKAKRTRELLASFYSTDPSAGGGAGVGSAASPRKMASPDSINSPSFDPDVYMSLLVPDPSSASPLLLSLGSLVPHPVWIWCRERIKNLGLLLRYLSCLTRIPFWI